MLLQETESQKTMCSRKNNSIAYWEKEEKLKKIMVEIIQQLQKTQSTNEGSSTSLKGWNMMWSDMPNTTPSIKCEKPQEYVVSQNKLILVEKIFQDINRQMLETNYTLNLGQLLKIVHELNKYLQKK